VRLNAHPPANPLDAFQPNPDCATAARYDMMRPDA